MHEINCPHCGKAFKIDEAGYANIVKQVRDGEFEQQLHERLELAHAKAASEPGIINAVEASNMFAELEHNYGAIGLEYARMLASEHKEIKTLVSGIINEFTETVAGSGDESFWLASCGALLAGAMLANRLGAELDVEAMRAFLIGAYYSNRTTRGTEGTEGGSYQNTEESLAAFLNFYVGGGYLLCIDNLFKHKNVKINVLRDPGKDHPIHVQIVRDQCMIIVSKREMKEYLQKRDIQTKGVFDGLVKYFKARQVKITLGAGTTYAQAQEGCFEIPVREDQKLLYDLLTAQGPPKV